MNMLPEDIRFEGSDRRDEDLFPVPEGYFDKFPESIITIVKKDDSHGGDNAGKVIRMFAYVAAIAAMFIMIIGVSEYFNDGMSLANSITPTEIIESEELLDTDVTLLAESIPVEDLEADAPSTTEEQQAIEEYLVENADISLLITDQN